MKDLCIKCKTKPVHIKSRGLCNVCVNRYYREETKKKAPPEHDSLYRQNKIRFQSEIDFIRNFFTHSNWVYQPAHFRLDGGGYQPDFYDGERNVFIEVSGTRQAFYNNLEKYRVFIRTFPKLNLEIRRANGDLISLTETEGTYHKNK